MRKHGVNNTIFCWLGQLLPYGLQTKRRAGNVNSMLRNRLNRAYCRVSARL